MPDIFISRPGQVNGAGDNRANFLQLWSGEVMAEYARESLFDSRHRMMTISSGKSYQFDAVGQASAFWFTPGNEMTGQIINHAKRTITVDQMVVSPVMVSNYDEAMNHYEIRGRYTTECGRSLARIFDERVARVICRAARTDRILDEGLDYGSSGAADSSNGNIYDATLTDSVMGTSSPRLIRAFWRCNEIFDTKNVPKNARHAAVAPAQFYLMLANPDGSSLAQQSMLLNRDYGGEANGGLASNPMTLRVGDIVIHKTNAMPSTNVIDEGAAQSGGQSYNGDFRQTKAIVWQEEAVATVQLLGLATESQYDVAKQATLIVSKFARGTGVLRPSSAIELCANTVADSALLPA